MGSTACKLKIILDSENLNGLTTALCEAADSLPAESFTDENAYPIIDCLNKAEEQIIIAQKKLLKLAQYDGPLPPFLKG